MKLLRRALLCVALALGAVVASAQTWQPIGPDYGTVLTLAHQPGNNAVALAGTYFGGLYRSTDWGFTWKAVDGGFSASSVFTIAFDRQTPQRVYAGGFTTGLWRSDDGGLTWSQGSNALSGRTIAAAAVDPTGSMRVIVATPEGGYASSDGGATWSPIAALANIAGRSVAFDPQRPGTAFFGTVGHGVFRSTDSGQTWSPLAGGPLTASALSIDAAGHLYVAGDAGVWQWPLGATAWVDLRLNLPSAPVAGIHAHPAAPNVLFAASGTGMHVLDKGSAAPRWTALTVDGARFVTTDAAGYLLHSGSEIGSMKLSADFGQTWVRGDHGMQTAFIGGLTSTPTPNGRRVIAATDLGVMTLDAGGAWLLALPLREGVFEVLTDGALAYAGMETTGVWKSNDRGDHWAPSSNGLVPTRVASLSRGVDTPATLYAATASGAYRSADGGAQWQPIRLSLVSYVHAIAADPVRPPIVWIGTGGGQVQRSIDGGQTFQFAGGNLPNDDIVKLAHVPWVGVYALTAKGELYLTVDDGRSWYRAQTGCAGAGTAIAVDPVRYWVAYLATASGLCKTESGGQTWSALGGAVAGAYLGALWIDPTNAQSLRAGGIGRIYRSNDGGNSWTTVTTGLPASAPITALASRPGQPQALFALAYGAGLYQSGDGGSTWTLRDGSDIATGALSLHVDVDGRVLLGTAHRGVQALAAGSSTWLARNDGMSLFVRSIALDRTTPNRLYAGTLGGGVFRSDDAAATWNNVGLAAGNVLRIRHMPSLDLLVGTTNGIAVSSDAGTSWAELGQRAAYVYSIAGDPQNASSLIVGGGAGQAWRPDDSGARWRHVGSGLPSANLIAMAACPNGALYAAADRDGVWRSTLAAPGAWVNAGSAGLANARLTSLACDPRSGLLYAGSNGTGAFLSLDLGANWVPLTQGLGGSIVGAVVPSRTQAWRVWAALQDGRVVRSDNAGLNWVLDDAGLPGAGGFSHLAAGADGSMYVAASTGVWRRSSAATQWSAGTGLPSARITALWADPSRANVLIAGVAGAGLYRSIDSGASWSAVPLNGPSPDIVSIGSAGSRIVVGTLGSGVAWSDDGGASFGAVQPPDQIPQIVTDMAGDAASPGTVYLATGGQGVLKSSDGGGHWRFANSGLGNLSLLALVAHPTRSGELYAGTHEGVFVSKNGGANWSALNDGLVNRNVTSLAFDKALPDILYVGLEGGGIYFHDTGH